MPIDQDGWILASFFFRIFRTQSLHKHAQKNLANIQPSGPHDWSITRKFTLACEQAPSKGGKKIRRASKWESERRDSASEASGTRGSL